MRNLVRQYLGMVVAYCASAAGLIAQQTIPVRAVAIEAATDSGLFRNIGAVRHLPDGRVLVNDPPRRRLMMLNADFRSFTVLADTAAGPPNRYTGAFVALIKYAGDSSLLIDREANVMIVIDPRGNFGRVIAPPKASDISNLLVPFCACGFDPKGRLVYRTSRPMAPRTEQSVPADGANIPRIFSGPDSAAIVRADFDTRSVDTITTMKIPVQRFMEISPRPGTTSGRSLFNPLPTTDEWVLLPDGTVAIIRAQDYHIDWIAMDGARTSTPKMPFDWKRITLEERESLLDSVKNADAVRRANAPAPAVTPGSNPIPAPPFMTVDAKDLADYYPPIRQGQVRADPEGNVWILPSTSTLSASGTSGLVWDVVNRKGEIAERVKLPDGRNLAGFGPGGIIYMIYAPSPGKILLERARITR